jgi:hypothetical protein
VALTCSSPPALASACWGSGGGRSGSVVSASGAGSLGAGSSGASGSGAGVALARFGLCLITLADLMKQNQLCQYTSPEEQDVYCAKKAMDTYSEDFFMIDYFTLKAGSVSTTVLVAGCGVTPAGGAVPTMAMVTAPIAEADGSVPTSWRSGSGGEVGGLQKDNVSVQQYKYMTTQQGNIFIPGGLDYMRFPFAHHLMTLWDQRQSFGQLHGWSGGVVPSRLSFGFPFRQGAPAFSGLAAALGRRWSGRGMSSCGV